LKAAYYYDERDIRVEEISTHQVGKGELLIKMGATSICGTDLRIYNSGHFKIPKGQKRVLGHELTGEIVDVGSGVNRYKKGMHIAVTPNIGCGTCNQCIQGNNNLCPTYEAFGISIDGGFQEYVIIPEIAIHNGNVIEIPDKLSFEEAALAEPLSCVYNSYNRIKTKPGDTVVIIGAGPIGALHTALSRSAGATKIIVADLVSSRLAKMTNFGADILVDSAEADLYAAVMDHTDGEGADVVIVACSVAAMQQLALKLAARNGRINFFGGLPEGKDHVELQTNLIHYKQLCIYATTGSTCLDHHISMNLIASGRINVKPLISKKYTVQQTPEAFEYALSGEGMKTFVVNQ